MYIRVALGRMLTAVALCALTALCVTADARADVLELPADLTTIEAEAFYNDASLDLVVGGVQDFL